MNEAYKALAEVCRKRNKHKKPKKDTEASSRRPFWAGSAPTASSSTSKASRGTESTDKETDPQHKHKHDASHAKPDSKPARSSTRGADAAPKAARAHSKPSHRHHHRDTDSDSSSEAGCASDPGLSCNALCSHDGPSGSAGLRTHTRMRPPTFIPSPAVRRRRRRRRRWARTITSSSTWGRPSSRCARRVRSPRPRRTGSSRSISRSRTSTLARCTDIASRAP